MHLWEGVVLAMHQIRSEKMKSFFSLLGVIMGVMFLIVVVTIVEGLDQYVRVEVTSQVFGINTVTVRRWGEAGVDNDREAWRARLRSPRLRYEDADAIRERLTVPALIGVESDTGASAVATLSRQAASPALLRQPFTAILSLSATGMPSNRPRDCPAAQRAWERSAAGIAPSISTSMKQFSAGLWRSMASR